MFLLKKTFTFRKKSGILEGGVLTKDEKVKLGLNHVKFDRSRSRRYIGNIGEMVAQEVLLKEGFEGWLLTPYYHSEESPLRKQKKLCMDGLFHFLS